MTRPNFLQDLAHRYSLVVLKSVFWRVYGDTVWYPLDIILHIFYHVLMQKTVLFLSLIFLVLILFASFFWFYEVRYFVGRAKVAETSFSKDNSYVFISPLKAQADGREKIRVTVFVLNNQGIGVAARKIILGQESSLQIETVRGLTDDNGRTDFDVSSTKPGEYYLEVKVDNQSLGKEAHLSYY